MFLRVGINEQNIKKKKERSNKKKSLIISFTL